MSCLAIIPARGGSKRIHKKNIKDFCGKPIIAYSIDAALKCKLIDRVMVSTEDKDIAATARSYGAEVPFYRSSKTADDHSVIADVVLEVIERYTAEGYKPDIICCIYPTAPLITVKDLLDSIEMIRQNPEINTVLPVVQFSFPIQRALQMDETGQLSFIWPENMNKRSQDLTPCYHDAGQFIVIRRNTFLKAGKFFTDCTAGKILPEYRVQDIDSEDDWIAAEYKYKFIHNIFNDEK